MKDFKYKIRASKSYELITSCSKKVRNELQWDFEENKPPSDAMIKIAIEVFNKVTYGYESPNIITYDMNNGNKNEDEGVRLYDKVYGTNYHPDYLIEKDVQSSNFCCTGRRDLGSKLKTIDMKNSTCRNIFEAKKFLELEPKYVCQLNTYGFIYGTEELELCNYLSSKGFAEIEKMVNTERYFNFGEDDIYFDNLQEELEHRFTYNDFNGMPDEKRISVREVPNIVNFQPTLISCVKKMNEFIEEYLE